MSQFDNIIIMVRARLQQLSIKLWLEPYYFDDAGCMESQLDILAEDFSKNLGISISNCRMALSELQDGALRKLASRKQYEETGIATFNVRRVNNLEGTVNLLDIECPIQALGSKLQEEIAKKFVIEDSNQIKIIWGGKIIDPTKTLAAQGLKNNQHLMVIVSQRDNTTGSDSKEAMYDRIRKIKMDVEAIVDSNRQLFEMEDQDGNPVFLPPEENRALLMAMGFCEKARAAIKRQHYDEALILLLEADERFATCNSKFLESVDNYALVNLDIVWCYLCLRNVTQLPDAERRLQICENSFKRSYGDNMDRLIALKGNACPERALLMRLHLLQGVVYFHQNQRNESYEKLEIAANELRELKVDEMALISLIEMGYEPFEARLGLRASSNNVEQAINFIHERKDKLLESRKRSEKERKLNMKLTHTNKNDKDWVNPRSVCTLVEMGFSRNLVVQALKQTKNDVARALDLLQTRSDELRNTVPPPRTIDQNIFDQLKQLGFKEELVRMALETAENDVDKAIEFLLKLYNNESELRQSMQRLTEFIAQTQSKASTSNAKASTSGTNTDTEGGLGGPSTSNSVPRFAAKILQKAAVELESLKAFKRFEEDVTENDQDYLDLPLVQEEQYLIQYKRLLEQ